MRYSPSDKKASNLRVNFFHTRFASQELNFHSYRPKADNNYGTTSFAFVSSKPWETISTNFKIRPYTSSTTIQTIPFKHSVLLFCIHVTCLYVYSAYSLSMLCRSFMLLFFMYINRFFSFALFLIPATVIDMSCRLYMSVTNTKAYATLRVTEHILFRLCIVIFLVSF